MRQGNHKSGKKTRRVYKRIILLAGGIISFIFISGKAVQQKQTVKFKKKAKQTQILKMRPTTTPTVTTIANNNIVYETTRSSRDRWLRFMNMETPLGQNNKDETDYFEINVSTMVSQPVIVQTLVGGRVSHCRLFGPGARMQDGNGFEIRLVSFTEGKYRFAVNGNDARGGLQQIFFKFADDCQVLDDNSTVNIIRRRSDN